MLNVVSLLIAKKTGMLTLEMAVMPAMTLSKKVKETVQQAAMLLKDKSGTFQILGMPPGLTSLNTKVNTIP